MSSSDASQKRTSGFFSDGFRTRVTPFVRYCIIGAGNTVLDFGIYTALTRGWAFWRTYFLLANAVSFVIVVTWSFFWNRRWTFQNHAPQVAGQYVRFITATVVGLGISEVVLVIGVRVFHLPDLLAKVIAGPLVVLWNFTAYRCWTFREHREVSQPPLAPPLLGGGRNWRQRPRVASRENLTGHRGNS